VILDLRALARAWRKGLERASYRPLQLWDAASDPRGCCSDDGDVAHDRAESIVRALEGCKICISWMARSRPNAAADAFQPPDEMRHPRSAATGSRAKRKDHLNVADNTRSEGQLKRGSPRPSLAEPLEEVDSCRSLRSEHRDIHSEETE
jgi:hypothetical protein